MKRIIIIIFLAVVFNFNSPGTVILQQRLRHVIEYTQENNRRSENENDIMKKKVILYMKLTILQMKIEQLNRVEGSYINSS